MTDFEKLYHDYFDSVYRFSYSLCRNETTAEEITQETFFKALRGIDHFQGQCKMNTWLCQIARNTYFSMCRKEKRIEPLSDSEAVKGNFVEIIMDKDSAMRLHRALHKLSDPYKEVFSLRTFGELSFAEIADVFSKTESWARVTFHRAKLMLKEEIE